MQLHLNSYGIYLHVKDQMFEIKVPAQDGRAEIKKQVAAKKIRSLWLSPHTAVSAAAVALALKHNIDMVFLEHNGRPLGRVWHSKLGSTPRIRKCQLEASLDARGADFIKKWLCIKTDNQMNFVRSMGRHRKVLRPYLEETAGKIADLTAKIDTLPARNINEIAEQLRGLEGTAGRLYFGALARVIPEQYAFRGRSFRPTVDAFNAFLNYAYGVLYSHTERALILAGLDPYVGFLHRDDYNHRSMVYDFIEPFRIYADVPIFRLFTAKKVRQDHYECFENSVGLTKEGKVLCVEALNRHLEDEKMRYRGRNRTRADIMQAEAYDTAGTLIGREKAIEPNTEII